MELLSVLLVVIATLLFIIAIVSINHLIVKIAIRRDKRLKQERKNALWGAYLKWCRICDSMDLDLLGEAFNKCELCFTYRKESIFGITHRCKRCPLYQCGQGCHTPGSYWKNATESIDMLQIRVGCAGASRGWDPELPAGNKPIKLLTLKDILEEHSQSGWAVQVQLHCELMRDKLKRLYDRECEED